MSNQHKHPTISFRISDAERKQIETRILASGMMKKDYFVRSCISLTNSHHEHTPEFLETPAPQKSQDSHLNLFA